ncbi:MAG: hypothetical protein F6K30_06235 [Cyanothece sp. SIO2G6]|nr:hypothetical protein [Cyanothece sp. SIO2G6]
MFKGRRQKAKGRRQKSKGRRQKWRSLSTSSNQARLREQEYPPSSLRKGRNQKAENNCGERSLRGFDSNQPIPSSFRLLPSALVKVSAPRLKVEIRRQKAENWDNSDRTLT